MAEWHIHWYNQQMLVNREIFMAVVMAFAYATDVGSCHVPCAIVLYTSAIIIATSLSGSYCSEPLKYFPNS